jgi:hypothetical protein
MVIQMEKEAEAAVLNLVEAAEHPRIPEADGDDDGRRMEAE